MNSRSRFWSFRFGVLHLVQLTSNTQFYESQIFCLFTFRVFFLDETFKLISKYTKNANTTRYIKQTKKPLCNTLNWKKLKFGICKIGCWMSWTRSWLRVLSFKGINIVVINVINVGLVLGIFRFGLIHLTVVLLFYSLLRCQMPNPRNFFDFFSDFFGFVIWFPGRTLRVQNRIKSVG